MKMPLTGFAGVLLALTVAIGCADKRPETLMADYDEAEMEQAIQQARASFGEFLKRFKAPQAGDGDFCVKVKIEDPNGSEHFWLTDLGLDAEPFSGIINNEPGVVKNVRLGQKYEFSRADVSDWMYMSNGTMQGNATLRVLLKSMPPEEADELRRRFGW